MNFNAFHSNALYRKSMGRGCQVSHVLEEKGGGEGGAYGHGPMFQLNLRLSLA